MATGFKGRLPAEMETALYRIVQESLTNTARHANAHKVIITMREDEDMVFATIADNGCGFDMEALRKSPDQDRGLGLAGMNERALLLDGSLTINASPGRGTVIEVQMPLEPTEGLSTPVTSDSNL